MDMQAGDGEQFVSTPVEGEPETISAYDEQPEQEQIQQPEFQVEAQAVNEPVGEDAPAAPDRQRPSEVVSRVETLSAAIEKKPDAPVNYVLRGEALIDGGDFELAAEDFRRALDLADAQAESANWGYISRALADRAREGLRRVQDTRPFSP